MMYGKSLCIFNVQGEQMSDIIRTTTFVPLSACIMPPQWHVPVQAIVWSHEKAQALQIHLPVTR